MKSELIEALIEMDRIQNETDEDGEREIAWYYWRDDIEDILQIPRGTLNTYDFGAGGAR